MHAAQPGTLGLIVSPTYPMLRDATLRTFTDVAGSAIREFHKTEMRAVLHNGSEVLFRSADQPDRLRGPNLHWSWIDEGALCPDQTWEVLIGRLRAGGKAGDCWITTTPKGRNWLYQRLDQVTLFRASTRDNPYLDTEFISSLESAYTGQFARQELEGEFVSFEGVVYSEFSRALHVRPSKPEYAYYVAGVDEGYTNPAVLLILGIDNDGRAHMVHEFYRRQVLQDDLVAEAKRLQEQYHALDWTVDPSAAGLIAALRDEGLPAVAAENAVTDGIQAVKARLVVAGDGLPRLTIAPDCVNTAAEFESYCWKDSKVGLKDEPEKVNDHAMDALRYAAMYLEGPRPRIRWL